jgi:hypothetical protein
VRRRYAVADQEIVVRVHQSTRQNTSGRAARRLRRQHGARQFRRSGQGAQRGTATTRNGAGSNAKSDWFKMANIYMFAGKLS